MAMCFYLSKADRSQKLKAEVEVLPCRQLLSSQFGWLSKMMVRVILGLYWGSMGDNGKENGNYYNGFYGWLSKIMVPFWVP